METLLYDARDAVRKLWKTPGLTSVAVLTLGLGIGAATAIFSLVNGVLLRPLPYSRPEQVVSVFERGDDGADVAVAAANFQDWRTENRAFQAVAAYTGGPAAVLGGSEPVRPEVTNVTADFFRVFRVEPVLGRSFASEETQAGGPPAAVVSHAFWRSQLGGVPLEKRAVQVYGASYPVVGVMPPGFHFPGSTDVWLAEGLASPGGRNAHNWRVVGRLREGVDPDAGRAELNSIQEQLRAQYGSEEVDAAGVNLRTLHEELVGSVEKPLLLLLVAAGLVLLITCVNTASTLLARGAARRQEMSIRAALGADRTRLVRGAFTESVLLALAGGVVGVALAAAIHRFLVEIAPAGAIPRAGEVRLDAAVLLFALGAALVSSLLFGLFPAFRTSETDLGRVLSGSRGAVGGGGGAWSLLVGVEVAFALLLLVGSGLLIRSFWKVMDQDPGFASKGVLTVDLALPDARYPDDASLAAFHQAFLQEIRSIPGVRSAGFTSHLPFGGFSINGAFDIEGREPGAGHAGYRAVGGDYFGALRIPLRAGRLFDERDRSGVPDVAVINEALAARYWPGDSPVGKRIRNLANDGWVYGEDRWVTIVGVVGNVRDGGLTEEATPELYVNAAQRPFRSRYATAVLHTDAHPARLVPVLRERLGSRFGDVPAEFRTMDERIAASVGERRFTMTILGFFAAVAAALAGVGIYGVVSYRVAQRTRELGIRLALGTTPAGLRRMVLAGSLRLVSLGLAAGAVGALLLTRLLQGLLYGVSPADPGTFVGVMALLLFVALAAAYVPARRATRVDPMVALRSE